ncbi:MULTISPECIES: outer membrane beta-barrel protein [unclassified Thalassolituus]|uniref:outer membrane beta-barrel protein n=1 Tax=unclassified Thalassolituus TaxID=2624967 RepID=UPI0025F4C980|nr:MULTISPECIES: outer membrane beta-barrel protein [unclassified Thalassolituus]
MRSLRPLVLSLAVLPFALTAHTAVAGAASEADQLNTQISEAAEAEEQSGFIAGANLSTSLSGEGQDDIDGYPTFTYDLDSGSFSAFVGYQTKRNNRIKLAFESRSFGFEGTSEEETATGLRLDWDFVYGKSKVHPFWSIGFGSYRLSDPLILEDTSIEGEDLSGFSFQLGLGVKIDLNKKAELSLGFERQAIGWQEVEITGRYDVSIQSIYAHNSVSAGVLLHF